MTGRLLVVGGEDHDLRIPFLLRLSGLGYDVAAAGTGDPAPFARAGLEYHPFRFGRFIGPMQDWRSVGTLAKMFRLVRPDIVQCFDTKPNLLVPLAARRSHGHSRSHEGAVPVVRTINGMGWVFSSDGWSALALRPIYRALHRVAARSTAATVFQNREDQDDFERHGMVGSGRSQHIPGSGVDAAAFVRVRDAGPAPGVLREQLGLGGAEIVITVTRLTRQKGIPALLQAAALVHAVRPGVRFLLVGPRQSEGPLAVTQAELDAHTPYVITTGPRADVPSLLGLADVFVFPTEYREGVPRAVLEAALAGLPIVATRMPGCTDIVRDGWSGRLVPPRNPAALADAILAMLCDRAAAVAMGRNAAELVQQAFTLDLVVARYAALYADLLRVRPIPRPSPEPGAMQGAMQGVDPC